MGPNRQFTSRKLTPRTRGLLPLKARHEPRPGSQIVQVSCRLEGFRVQDGNTWWYRIAQSPWNNQFYVTADVFYNNGQTSGSLAGTPFVDEAVPLC